MYEQKNIIITGTNRGIGQELVKAFAEQGANIYAHARKESKEFRLFLEEVSEKNGVKIVPVYFDMTDSVSMKKALRENVFNNKTQIDVLVNNAGIAHGGMFQMTSMEKIREVFEVNFFSMCEMTQLVCRNMMRQKSGAIVNVASISGLELNAGNCAYGVSKAAVIAFTKTISKELARYGIRVNAIAPGLTDTDMATLMEEKAGIEMVQSSSMQRLGKKREIVNAVLFLAGEGASFITGQTLRVDGGR